MPTLPWWWSWELSLTRHMKIRMEERDVTELDLRAMLEPPLPMTERELQITYRRGRVLAAYLYFARDAETKKKSVRTVPSSDGLLVVDYTETGKPLGVEIVTPQAVTLERLNQLLTEIGEAPMAEQEFQPLRAA
jgi:hypothetical protein